MNPNSARAKRLVVSLSALLILSVKPVFAWGPEGHLQVADIAWTRLSARAKVRIAKILNAGEPAFRPKGTSDAALRLAFRRAALFPDEIKGNTGTVYEETILKLNRKWIPDFDPDTKDHELFRCKTWHYYDTPLPTGGPHPIRTSNALTALNFARAELARLNPSGQNRFMQCWWLYWINHVVGDVHQPLHCAESFALKPGGDSGGNGFALGVNRAEKPVRSPRERKMTLHSYWDSGIKRAIRLGSAGQSRAIQDVSARWSADPLLQPSRSDLDDSDIEAWIREGAELAQSTVYQGIQPNGVPSDAYVNRQVFECKKKAVLGGYRLARLLNKIYGE